MSSYRLFSTFSSSFTVNRSHNAGFQKLFLLSDEMARVTGHQVLSRSGCTKYIWKYIKANDLQLASKRTEIVCDSVLQGIIPLKQVKCVFPPPTLCSRRTDALTSRSSSLAAPSRWPSTSGPFSSSAPFLSHAPHVSSFAAPTSSSTTTTTTATSSATTRTPSKSPCPSSSTPGSSLLACLFSPVSLSFPL